MRTPGLDPTWPAALTALYRERFTDLVRVGYLITGSAAVAQDLTHDAFIASAPKMDDVEFPYAYVRTAVVNRARTWHRRRDVERRNQPSAPEPTTNEADELWDALGRLDDGQRAAIVLRYYDDVPDTEIAQILECAQPTVRTLVHRGLEQLRKEIKK